MVIKPLTTLQFLLLSLLRKVETLWKRGRLVSSEETKQKRTAICQDCRFRDGAQCEICTCVIALKVFFADEVCPNNPPRWDKEK